MRIHYLQHVPFEGLGFIKDWIISKGYTYSATRFYKQEPLPKIDKLDWLIILGGPMSTYDDHKYSWLKKEKIFVEQAIISEKKVLGICLGAQIIADVLGARVFPNKFKEIGWFFVKLTNDGKKLAIFDKFPKEFHAFHWHGDTFDLPDKAIRVAESEACKNQAFVYGKNVVGLQFHLELTKKSIKQLIKNCKQDLIKGPYIQNSETIMLLNSYLFKGTKKKLNQILNKLEKD